MQLNSSESLFQSLLDSFMLQSFSSFFSLSGLGFRKKVWARNNRFGSHMGCCVGNRKMAQVVLLLEIIVMTVDWVQNDLLWASPTFSHLISTTTLQIKCDY